MLYFANEPGLPDYSNYFCTVAELEASYKRCRAFKISPELVEPQIIIPKKAFTSQFAGFNEGYYAKFSRNFDHQMKTALPEAAFNQMRQSFVSKLGLYNSVFISRKHFPKSRNRNQEHLLFTKRSLKKKAELKLRWSLRKREKKILFPGFSSIRPVYVANVLT